MVAIDRKKMTKAPRSTQKAINQLLQASQEPLKATFLTRGIEGLIAIAEATELVDITAADSKLRSFTRSFTNTRGFILTN